MDIRHEICHIYHKNADFESIFSLKDSLHCCYKCAKFSSTCKIIFIFSCILSSVLWDNFLWMTLYQFYSWRLQQIGAIWKYSENSNVCHESNFPHDLILCHEQGCLDAIRTRTQMREIGGAPERVIERASKGISTAEEANMWAGRCERMSEGGANGPVVYVAIS